MALLAREESMLLVIDVQDNFYPETRDDVDRDAYSAFVDRAAWLVAAATALSVPVVVTEEQAEANGPTEPRVRQYLNEATPILRKDFFAASDNPHIRQAIDATGRIDRGGAGSGDRRLRGPLGATARLARQAGRGR